MNEKCIADLIDILTKECVKTEEILANYTTFRIGGPSDLFLTVESAEQLANVLNVLKHYEIPYTILGKGSNLLVGDKGYRGAVIKLAPTKAQAIEAGCAEYECLVTTYGIDHEKKLYRSGAGTSLIVFAMEIARAGLTGFEFATGVPGTVGGAVTMNAGAYGQEIKDTILEATVVTPEGEIKKVSASDLHMGYRTCDIQTNGWLVVDAVFAFAQGQKEEILAQVAELSKKRAEKQPLEFPSAGSTFKRPEGHFAGKLIMDAGLRGYQIGGAQVSKKHCGFVINAGGATAKDVIDLIHYVQDVVKEKFDVMLETEVKFLGEF